MSASLVGSEMCIRDRSFPCLLRAFEASDRGGFLQLLRRRDQCGIRLRALLKRHRQIPQALGSGSSNIDQKVRRLTMKFCCECQGIPDAVRIMKHVRGVCVDMGTEMAITEVRGPTVNDMLPDWMQDVIEADVDAPDVVGLHNQEFVLPGAVLSA
eukprot:13495619-Alexandrium_andersonii.AAC.1